MACLSNYTRRWFAWVQISVVIPMSLIGGTYFPTEVLPTGLRWISFLLPLTHTNIVIRKLIVGQVDYLVFLHLAVIFWLWLLFKFILRQVCFPKKTVSLKRFQNFAVAFSDIKFLVGNFLKAIIFSSKFIIRFRAYLVKRPFS